MCSNALTQNWIELHDDQIGSQVVQKLTVLIAKADFRTETLHCNINNFKIYSNKVTTREA